MDEGRGNFEMQQTIECFARHRPRKNISADDYAIDMQVAKFCEDRFESGKIAVNVVNRRDSHERITAKTGAAGWGLPPLFAAEAST